MAESIGDLQVEVDAVRPLLTCTICSDWFKDAHTVMECLHTFCLGCLRAEFGYDASSDDVNDGDAGNAILDDKPEKQESKGGPDSVCPVCKIALGADPIKNAVRPDCTMQSLANRIKRSLTQDDEPIGNLSGQGSPMMSPSPMKIEEARSPKARPRSLESDDVSLIDVALIPITKSSPSGADYPEEIFLRTNSQLSIQQLRKYLSAKFGAVSEEYEITWSGEVLGPEYTLDFIQKTRSQSKGQLRLVYMVSSKSKTNF